MLLTYTLIEGELERQFKTSRKADPIIGPEDKTVSCAGDASIGRVLHGIGNTEEVFQLAPTVLKVFMVFGGHQLLLNAMTQA